MPSHRHGTLAYLALVLSTFAAAAPAAAAPVLEYVARFSCSSPRSDPNFGGFSGIEIGDDGNSFHVLSDRAWLYWGSVERDSAGRMRGLNIAGRAHLKDSKGNRLPPGRLGDSEGLAIAPDGKIWVSFEGLDRLAVYDNPDANAGRVARPPVLKELKVNSGMEALAMLPDGSLLALPERSGLETRPFPVLRYRPDSEKWDVAFQVARQGRWLPVGADIGPDGRLYLLERDFRGLLGFSSRVRRFDLDGLAVGDVAEGQELLETLPLQYDNLEGISVWDDGQGLRLTLVSDDNFFFAQRTELVEYRLRE